MPRPGVSVITRAAPPARGLPSATGTWFVAGLAERGPTTAVVAIRNMTEYEENFGARVSYGLLYDSLEAFFREGGTLAYVARVVGPSAVTDTLTFNDSGAAASIAVDSIGKGDSGLSAAIVAGTQAGTFAIVITDASGERERSIDLTTPAEAVAWSQTSPFVRVRSLGSNAPAVAAGGALATGADDRASITDTERAAALDRFSKALGVGQVSYPGATTGAMYLALLAHAAAKNRVALLDGADTATDATLITAATTIRSGGVNEAFGALFAPWVLIPGVVPGTTRTIPPSAVAAGLIARSDSATSNPNVPAAGGSGESRFAIGLSQVDWSDAVRETLNTDGIDVFRLVYGAVRLYGFRTLVTSTDPWISLAAARTRMGIANDADHIAEAFLFSQLDGQGRKVSEFHGALAGVLQGYWVRGALYGTTATEAFSVDTGASVNTPATLAADELHAVLSLRISPFAELVQIEIAKVAVSEPL